MMGGREEDEGEIYILWIWKLNKYDPQTSCRRLKPVPMYGGGERMIL